MTTASSTQGHLARYLENRTRDNLRRVLEEYQRVIARAAGLVFRSRAERPFVEDAVGEFTLMLTRCAPKKPIRSESGFISKVAMVAALRIRNRELRYKQHEHAFADLSEEPFDSPRDPATDEDVRRAIEALPEKMRKCVRMKVRTGLDNHAIGAELGISVRAVQQHIRAACEQLRRILGADYAACVAPFLLDLPQLPPLSAEMAECFAKCVARHPERIASPTPEASAHTSSQSSISSRPSARATRRSMLSSSTTVAAAAAIALLFLTAWLILSFGSDDAATTALEITPPSGAGGSGEVTSERDAVAFESADSRDDPREGVADGGDADDTDGAALEDPPDAAEDDEADGTRVLIRVVDEQGALVQSGSIRFDLPLGSTRKLYSLPASEAEPLLPWRQALDEVFDLAEGNPFEFFDLPEGLAGIELECEGASPGLYPSEPVRFVPEKDALTEVEVVLREGATRTVHVLDAETGEPIAGARVHALSEIDRRHNSLSPSDSADGPGRAVTDTAGLCVVEGLGDGDHEYEVLAPGYVAERVLDRTSDADVTDSAGGSDPEEERADLEVRLRRAPEAVATVVAYVSSHTGQPVADVEVKLHAQGESTYRIARSDVRGECTFEDVPPGLSSLNISWDTKLALEADAKRALGKAAEGYVPAHRLFQVNAGQKRRVKVGYIAGTASIEARIVDEHGRPVPNVEAKIMGDLRFSRRSDADGVVVFDRLADGKYLCLLDRWQVAEIELAAGEPHKAKWTIGSAVLRGHVVAAADARVLEDVSVSVDQQLLLGVRTDADGRFELRNVPAGKRKIRASAYKGGFLSYHSELDVAIGDEVFLDIALRRGASILITFSEACDRSRRRWLECRGVDGTSLLLSPVDDSGEAEGWEATGLVPGRYEVELRLPDEEPRAKTVILEGTETVRVKF